MSVGLPTVYGAETNIKEAISVAKSERYVLIDGHSLAYRAFYALPSELATSSGQLTNAVYGFTSMLIKVLEETRPRSVIVAFDKGKPHFRTEKFEEYKAHRKPMPEELREQMDIIHALLEALGIPCLEEEGFEADDVLATLTEAIPQDKEIFIVTGDRDALQLVDDRVRVIANRKGITDIVVYDHRLVREKYGIEPEQIVDYLALKGDTSDNIPGVPGIGEKSAAALINEYGNLDAVYDHLDEITNKRWRKALEENRQSAYLSRELARMRRDVPVADKWRQQEWELKPWDEQAVQRLFSSLEFKKLYERLAALKSSLFGDAMGTNIEECALRPKSETTITDLSRLEELRRDYRAAGELSLYAELEGEGFTSGRIASLSAAVGGHVYYLDLDEEGATSLLDMLLNMLDEDREVRLNCYRGKDIQVQLAKAAGHYPQFDFDVQLASYLVNPAGVRHDLENALSHYLGLSLQHAPVGQMGLLEEKNEKCSRNMVMALAIERLVPHLEAEMNLKELRALHNEVEIPLQRVLADMEIKGVRLDTEALKVMQTNLEEEMRELEERVFELAGESFNLNSPQQLSRILFEVLRLTPVKRTKTGYATDISVLNALKDQHPIIEPLSRYRELSKLLNTYVVALPRMVDKSTGRLHTSFNQAVTATGRLSSSNPNLQNIPVRTPLGGMIRKAFLPTSDDGAIISADYSQIELRILAHLSGDLGLKKAFEKNLDIHTATASEVFGVPLDQVSSELRRRAKAINFGIIYGISPYGLSEQLDITQEEAESYIQSYFQKYPQVRQFMDMQAREAAARGYVLTLLGRRREIPELATGNVRMRRFGERLAFNTPIQGSAADIIKLAMLRVYRRLKEEACSSHMILQVHDELVFDVAPGEVEKVKRLVVEEMERAYELDVPLSVEVGVGPSWYDAK
jgi:DNA polymerase-1